MRHKAIYGFLIALLATGCSVSKYVPANESLYVGGHVEVIPDSAARLQVDNLDDELESLLRPNPNATLFGFPYKVWLYYFIGEPRREKGFRNWFRKKFGEPPVFASSRVVGANAEVLAAYMINQGYFRSRATGELIENKNRTAEAYYKAYAKPRYFINEVQFVAADTSRKFYRDFLATKEQARGTLLKKGAPYRLEVIEAERQRIDRLLKQKGYYYFSPEYIIAKVDSTEGTHEVNIFIDIKPTTSQLALKQYYINEIYVYADYDALSPDTSQTQTQLQMGLHVADPKNNYRPRIFDDAIGFNPGSQYSSAIHDVSLSRLINLNNFKFVKNRFELLPRSDSALLNVYYYLTPSKKKSLRTELSGVTKSNNLAGTQLDVSWSHRNIFRAAERLRISANGGIDWQIGGIAPEQQSNFSNFIRYSIQGELSFPRFIIPFYKIDPAISQSLPQTVLSAGYESLTQGGLYTQTSLRAQGGYSWRRNREVEHTLTPFGVNLIKPRNISEAFVDTIFASNNPQDLVRFLQILDTRLILENSYTISYKPTPSPFSRNQFLLSGGINLAGNLAGLFDRYLGKDDGELFGVFFEQFARLDGEVRYYRDLSPSLRLANRFIGGLGIPYGNSRMLPQFKQYFAGGTTGLRAFRARTLGPGNYNAAQSVFGNSSF
jgi:outer membrane protein assembly factor BamA